MNLACHKNIYRNSALLRRHTSRCALVAFAGLGMMFGNPNFCTAACPSTVAVQEDDEEDNQDDEKQVELDIRVVGDEGQAIGEELQSLNVKIQEALSKHEGQLGDHEILVIRGDGLNDPELNEKLKKHNIRLNGLFSGAVAHPGQHKVIKIHADGKDDPKLHQQLKEHGIHLQRAKSGKQGENNMIWIQAEEDKHDGQAVLHRHLVQLSEGTAADKVDHKALANQLRKIADRLEQADGDLHQDNNVRLHVQKRGNKDMTNQPGAELGN